MLTSARFFDSSLHREDILIISKFPWIHHMHGGRLEYPDSLCVVIDEAHQGRGGMGYSNIESAHFTLTAWGNFKTMPREALLINTPKSRKRPAQGSSYAIAVNCDTHQYRHGGAQLHTEQHPSRERNPPIWGRIRQLQRIGTRFLGGSNNGRGKPKETRGVARKACTRRYGASMKERPPLSGKCSQMKTGLPLLIG